MSTNQSTVFIVTGLLELHGQGGQCSDIVPDFSYHNSFLIADNSEAWVLETADKLWVAERVVSGARNISNCLSIQTNIDLHSPGLKELARERGWWDGVEPFNWCQVIGGEARGSLTAPDRRWQCGRRLLQEKSGAGQFSVGSMMEVLRDKDSGINRPGGDFPTAASQVSTLGSNVSALDTATSTNKRPGHWFTASPDPDNAVFKPFVFGQNMTDLTNQTKSPQDDKLSPEERQHDLWKSVMTHKGNNEVLAKLEQDAIAACEEERLTIDGDVQNIFNEFVEREMSERK